MSAQGASLQRQGMHLPIWPVVALVVIATAAMIGLQVMDDAGPAPRTATVTGEASTSKGIVRPVETEHVLPVLDAAAIESASAAVRERSAEPFHSVGRAHEVILGGGAATITYPSGLENPGGYITAPLAEATGGPGYGDCIHCQQRR